MLHVNSFTYDRGERPVELRDGGNRPLKTFSYATANGPSNWKNGKLEVANRFNYVYLGTTSFTVQVRETYTYSGRGGRVSARATDSVIGGGVVGFTQSWVYDPLGNVTSIGYPQCTTCGVPAPRTVGFGYQNGRLSSVSGYTGTVAGQPAGVGISYHANGMVHRVAHANGVTWTQAADPAGMRRPGALSTAGAINPNGTNADWSSGSYAFDGTGNVVGIGTSWFLYDPVSRLATATQFDGLTGGGTQKLQTYTHDAFGNIQSIGGTSGRATPTDSATNQLTNAIYDQTGNLRFWSDHYYEFDALQQPWWIETGTHQWIHLYTADDERLWSFQAKGGVKNRWTLRDLDGRVLREYSEDQATGIWRVERDLVYRGATLLAADTPTGRIHYHPDHLGSPRLITNASRHKIAYHLYYPFGEEATAFNQDSERMKFTGHERDLHDPAGPGDDLDYMHARFCSPLMGRFLSVDRHDVLSLQFGDMQDRAKLQSYLTAPQSWNRYTYARGNPLHFIDPNGEEAVAATVGTWALLAEGGAEVGVGAAAAGAAPLIIAVGAGIALGYGVNQIPGVSEALTAQPVSDALADVFFSGGQARATRDFINAKVATVFEHIGRYPPPDPNDPRDKSKKKGVGERMRKHLEAARDRLKRLKGDTRELYEDRIRRAEEALKDWLAGISR